MLDPHALIEGDGRHFVRRVGAGPRPGAGRLRRVDGDADDRRRRRAGERGVAGAIVGHLGALVVGEVDLQRARDVGDRVLCCVVYEAQAGAPDHAEERRRAAVDLGPRRAVEPLRQGGSRRAVDARRAVGRRLYRDALGLEGAPPVEEERQVARADEVLQHRVRPDRRVPVEARHARQRDGDVVGVDVLGPRVQRVVRPAAVQLHRVAARRRVNARPVSHGAASRGWAARWGRRARCGSRRGRAARRAADRCAA